MRRSTVHFWTFCLSISSVIWLTSSHTVSLAFTQADDTESPLTTDQEPAGEDQEDLKLGIEEETTELQRKSGSVELDSPAGTKPGSDCPEDDIVIRTPITQLSASIVITQQQTPEDCSTHIFQGMQAPAARTPQVTCFHWRPTNFFHQPLYFDDTPLERYGQSVCPTLQPIISGIRFFGTIPVVPYKMGIDRTHDCVSTLGYYRPGNCHPCVRERFPALELDASLLEAGTALALVFALP
jgi:hypothetical protein